MKKILAMFLAALMVFTMLSACGDTSQQSDNNVENNDEESVTNTYRDFYEQEFRAAYYVGTSPQHFFWPEPTTTSAERNRKVSEEVQEALNCILAEDPFADVSSTMWAQKFAVGDYTYTWTEAMTNNSPIETLYEAGFIQSWNNIPAVDLSDESKWGSAKRQANVSFGGEVYAATSGTRGGTNGLLVYNKLLAMELNNSVLPQDLYEQNNWTWDTFEDYLASVTVKEADRTVHGMSVYEAWDVPYCAVFSNGGNVVTVGEDGVARFSLTDANAIEALDWAQDLYATGSVYIDDNRPPATWAKEGAVFMLGNNSFGTASSGTSTHWGLDNLDDIRYVPFPRGPRGDGSVGGSYASSSGGVVILFGNEKEDSGYVWNARLDIAAKYATDNEDEWKRKTFFQDDDNDNDSYNNYIFCVENYNMNYASQLGSTQRYNLQNLLQNVLVGGKTPTEAMTGVAGVIQAQLDKNMNG